ncbi:MAG: squalene synthase HpnC [Thalassobaculales bacterium]
MPALPEAARRENFPVASRLLPPATRDAVHAFYRFARAADDVADHPELSTEGKLALLHDFARGLSDGVEGAPAEALALREVLARHGMKPVQPLLLLQAFRQDAVQNRLQSWSDLMLYCRYSAAPVGRFLLELHGAPAAATRPADALCIALQLINHLQDCGEDYRRLDRVYLPREWFEAEGAQMAELDGRVAGRALARVFARMVERIDQLLAEARPLPGLLPDRRFRLEAAVILSLAQALAALLRHADPLAGRPRLGRLPKALAVMRGLWRGLFA